MRIAMRRPPRSSGIPATIAATVVAFFAGGDPEAAYKGLHSGKAIDIWERPLTQARVFWSYLGQYALPLPGRLSLVHEVLPSRSLIDPPATAVAVAGLVVVAIGAWWFRRIGLLVFSWM